MWHILMLLRRTDSFPCAQWSWRIPWQALAPKATSQDITRKSCSRFMPHRIKVMLQCRLHGWGVKEGKRERCATGPVKGEEQVCRVLFCFVTPKLMNQNWIKPGNTALPESFWRDLCDLWGRWSQASWFSLSPMRLQTVWRVLRMPRRNLWAPAGHDFGYFGVFCILLYCIVLRCTKYY